MIFIGPLHTPIAETLVAAEAVHQVHLSAVQSLVGRIQVAAHSVVQRMVAGLCH
jgi:hypothetical protein